MQTDAERLRDVLAEYRRHVDRGHDEAAQTAHVRHLAIVEDIQAVPDPVATGGRGSIGFEFDTKGDAHGRSK